MSLRKGPLAAGVTGVAAAYAMRKRRQKNESGGGGATAARNMSFDRAEATRPVALAPAISRRSEAQVAHLFQAAHLMAAVVKPDRRSLETEVEVHADLSPDTLRKMVDSSRDGWKVVQMTVNPDEPGEINAIVANGDRRVRVTVLDPALAQARRKSMREAKKASSYFLSR